MYVLIVRWMVILFYLCILLLKAIEVVEDTGDKAAAFHLARQLENAVRTTYNIYTHKHRELKQHMYVHTQAHTQP